MKLIPSLLLAAAVLTTLAENAQAQIVFGPAQAITGSDNINTLGSYVDAITTRPNKTSPNDVKIIGDTTFNVGGYNADNSTFGDGKIVFSVVGSYLGGSGDSFDGTFTTGNSTNNAKFGAVLQGTVYDDHAFDNITLNDLTRGYTYEVQLFKANADSDSSRNLAVVGGNTVQLDAADFTIGTFVATGASQSFSFGPGTGGGAYGEANAIDLRLVATPEPSTYAMLLAGLTVLGFCVRRKNALEK